MSQGSENKERTQPLAWMALGSLLTQWEPRQVSLYCWAGGPRMYKKQAKKAMGSSQQQADPLRGLCNSSCFRVLGCLEFLS